MLKRALLVTVVGGSSREAEVLARILRVRWHEMQIIHLPEFDSALTRLSSIDPDLIFVHAAGESPAWPEFLSELRKSTRTALVVLHRKSNSLDRIEAFEVGADECITTATPPMEILARIGAVLRRTPHSAERLCVVGTLAIDVEAMKVSVGEKHVNLSPREFQILVMLAQRPNIPVQSDELLGRAWGPAYIGESDLLRKSIFRLRRKLETRSMDGQPAISNVRGIGYVLTIHQA